MGIQLSSFTTAETAAQIVTELTAATLEVQLPALQEVVNRIAGFDSPAVAALTTAYTGLTDTSRFEEHRLAFAAALRALPAATWRQIHAGKPVTRFADAAVAAQVLRTGFAQLQSSNPTQVDPDTLIAAVQSITQETLSANRVSYLDILRTLFPFMNLNLSRLNGVGRAIEQKGLKDCVQAAMSEVGARMAMEIERETEGNSTRTVIAFDAACEVLLMDDDAPEELAAVLGQIREGLRARKG